jgi:hypothetical protein
MLTRKLAVAALTVLVLSIVTWNVAWRYDEATLGNGAFQERAKVRTHIFTGRAERLTRYGWRPMAYEAHATGQPIPNPTGSPTVYDRIVDAPSQ